MENTGRCHSCEVVNININGVQVQAHEHGCPDAWRDEIRECAECGSEFEPEDSHQTYCDHACFCAAYGIRDDEGEEFDEGDISDSYDAAPGHYGPDRERASY